MLISPSVHGAQELHEGQNLRKEYEHTVGEQAGSEDLQEHGRMCELTHRGQTKRKEHKPGYQFEEESL